jgi:hypothetical protein
MDKTYVVRFRIPDAVWTIAPEDAARAIADRFHQKLGELRRRELLAGLSVTSENAPLLSFSATGPEIRFRPLADYFKATGEGELTPNLSVVSSGRF